MTERGTPPHWRASSAVARPAPRSSLAPAKFLPSALPREQSAAQSTLLPGPIQAHSPQPALSAPSSSPSTLSRADVVVFSTLSPPRPPPPTPRSSSSFPILLSRVKLGWHSCCTAHHHVGPTFTPPVVRRHSPRRPAFDAPFAPRVQRPLAQGVLRPLSHRRVARELSPRVDDLVPPEQLRPLALVPPLVDGGSNPARGSPPPARGPLQGPALARRHWPAPEQLPRPRRRPEPGNRVCRVRRFGPSEPLADRGGRS